MCIVYHIPHQCAKVLDEHIVALVPIYKQKKVNVSTGFTAVITGNQAVFVSFPGKHIDRQIVAALDLKHKNYSCGG